VLLASTLEPLMPLRTDTPPVIDGNLDDEVWERAPHVAGFKTWYPDFGKDMADDTEVYFAYDREHLYFAFRSFDSQPDKIKASVSARDKIHSDDWVCINLDSFHDHQSLYTFYVNPLGIQRDTKYAGGPGEDVGFDVVWYSAGKVDAQGYSVEVRIPFKSIRYRSSEPVEMGIIFERSVSRLSSRGTYPPLDPRRGADWLNQTHPIVYEDVEHYQLFELLPAVTHSRRSELEENDLVAAGDHTDLSLTAKYGITSDLILDGTLNPDFSQVEADAGQIDINLRAPLFFPETRPFFLEGIEYWNPGGPTQDDPLRSVVHTRNIANPLGGVKLSGKITASDTVAALYSRDELSKWDDAGDDSDFAILRYKHAIKGDTYVGGFYTGREGSDGFNRVFGVDGLLRTSRSSTISYHALASRTAAGDLPRREDGHAVGAHYGLRNRSWDVEVTALDISEAFRTDVGYVNRTGVFRGRVDLGPRFYPSGGFIQRIDPSVLTEHTYDKQSGLWESFSQLQTRLVLPRSSRLSVSYNHSTEIFLAKEFDTTRLRLSGSSQITKALFVSGSYSRGGAIYFSEEPYQGDSRQVGASLRWQPTDKIDARADYTYSSFTRRSDGERIYDYTITRGRLTYQVNRHLFFRGIVEHNAFHDEILTDFLASFTYIPGTVIHLGYGSLYRKTEWRDGVHHPGDRFRESQRGLFFKASYLWRL
jgi:hypothetical protein